MTSPSHPSDFVIVADVHILDLEPRVSRTLELPVDFNFAELHEVLQAAFGWTDSHIHEFNVGGLIIGAPEFDDHTWSRRQTFEATEVWLRDLVFPCEEDASLRILYVYDPGDNWRHQMVLRRVPAQAGVKYPRCVAGERSSPPEEVGGTTGYVDFLEAWRDPTHEEHRAMRRWAGRKFDPERFDLDAANKAIRKALRLSQGEYGFRLRRP
ncbi:pRiA4b ORF-3-like protein [Rhodoblastus acidophilus]|uniref:PRiA4b ORF-3-like protein n=1 Tax=Rhodoblastus acidophilus TaxID=1074 RepID=A0A212SGD3_RHOAC|nr:plasmid pRiA4b ORF-3 family protein [Rhodoblastus acidophilus]PPQ34809.1 plasmid pRiA4b ORF-3 family protein [Rhodoblastus acidophilus]RAI16507.1 plasmid pRiA4b ORF-3 family protein [Rhodoblastus acidophilus]SNB84670.1 pRiA4b ORF-3-like protein [Rhodoblastus acidophilus]